MPRPRSLTAGKVVLYVELGADVTALMAEWAPRAKKPGARQTMWINDLSVIRPSDVTNTVRNEAKAVSFSVLYRVRGGWDYDIKRFAAGASRRSGVRVISVDTENYERHELAT